MAQCSTDSTPPHIFRGKESFRQYFYHLSRANAYCCFFGIDCDGAVFCYVLGSVSVTMQSLQAGGIAIDPRDTCVVGDATQPVAKLVNTNAPVPIYIYRTLATLCPKLTVNLSTDFMMVWVTWGMANIVPVVACRSDFMITRLQWLAQDIQCLRAPGSVGKEECSRRRSRCFCQNQRKQHVRHGYSECEHIDSKLRQSCGINFLALGHSVASEIEGYLDQEGTSVDFLDAANF